METGGGGKQSKHAAPTFQTQGDRAEDTKAAPSVLMGDAWNRTGEDTWGGGWGTTCRYAPPSHSITPAVWRSVLDMKSDTKEIK